MRVAAQQLVLDHIKQQTALEAEKQLWKPVWQDIADYVLPRRSSWEITDPEGTQPSVKTYDSTALDSLQTFVDGFQGNLISPAFVWLRLIVEDPELARLPGVMDYLELLDNIFLAQYQKTPLYDAVNEFIADYASIGTAIMLAGDDLVKRNMVFSTRHIRECAIAENGDGQVDVLYRKYQLTNRQIVQAFPDSVSADRRDEAKLLPFKKGTIIHAAFPSVDDSFSTLRDPSMPYTCEYIDVEKQTHLFEGGYESFPYLVARFRKNAHEVYGRSPASDALSAVLRINTMAKSVLHSAQLANEPPLNVPKEMAGKERIIPRGYNYYTDPKKVITAIDVARNYPIGRDQEEDVREQIRSIFRSRMFMLLQALEGQKAQTATWVNKVASEQAVILGPVVGRFNNEFLVPLVRRTYQILFRQGRIPPLPPSLARGGAAVKIELQGPLAQAQRRYHQSQGVQAGMEFLAGLVQLFPDALDLADGDELGREGMDAMGMPQRVIREVDAVEYMRKQRADTLKRDQAAQAAASTDQMVGQNVDKFNQPMKPGSMLEGIMRKGAQRPQRQPAPAGAGPA